MSEGGVRAMTPGNGLAAGPGRAETARVGTNFMEGHMTEAQTSESMSPELQKVAERARRDPETRFHSLAHLIDQAALQRAFHRQRGNAAAGTDGTGISRSVGSTSRKKDARGRRDRSASPASKTSSCRNRCARSWRPCMSRSFEGARMVSGADAAHTVPCVSFTTGCIGGK